MAKIKVNDINLSYIQEKGDGKKCALIMHGWGANKELMKQFFLKTLKPYCKILIFLDFAGFGGSDEPKRAFDSLDYLKLTQDFLAKINQKADLLVGHSYGGKIACLMASKSSYDGLILCSSAGLKLPKSFKIKCKIALAKIFKSLGIKNMRKFLASDDGARLSEIMYATFKNVVDEDFSYDISQISSKTLLLWGEDDKATPLEIGKKMQNLIKNSKLHSYKGDHFFFMQNDISKEISEFLR